MVCTPQCGYEYVKQQKIKQAKKEKKEWYEKNITVQELMKMAQKVFNTYIRERDKGRPCISCERELKGKFDCGHYFSSGGHKSVTYNLDNCHGQCVYCNQHLHGNLLNYQIGIEKRIGGERLLKLHELAHQERKYTREELRDIIAEYKQKIKDLKK